MNRAEVEVERYWPGLRFICGECRRGINYLQDVCRGCKAMLLWTEYDSPNESTVEHTETAE